MKKIYFKIFLSHEYLCEFSKKFEVVLMGYSGARGTLLYEKNLMSKFSCQTPLN
jgi:hypothetical protein